MKFIYLCSEVTANADFHRLTMIIIGKIILAIYGKPIHKWRYCSSVLRSLVSMQRLSITLALCI